MNPDEFRDRVTGAVEPINADPRSYERLRASIARRRRSSYVTWVTAAATLAVVAGVGVAVARPTAVRRPPVATTSDTPTASPTPSESPTPSPTSSQAVVATPAADRQNDIDGDGKADVATLVTEPGVPVTDPRWRYGIRAVMSSLGTQTVWRPRGVPNEAQSFTGLADLDGDGDAEIVMSPGGWVGGVSYDVVNLIDGHLVWVTFIRPGDLATSDFMGIHDGWRCHDTGSGRVLVQTHDQPSADGSRVDGYIETYQLTGATLRRIDRHQESWAKGAARPPAYLTGIDCGGLVAVDMHPTTGTP